MTNNYKGPQTNANQNTTDIYSSVGNIIGINLTCFGTAPLGMLSDDSTSVLPHDNFTRLYKTFLTTLTPIFCLF